LDPQLEILFNLIRKDNENIQVHAGDDLTMKSVAPYGIPTGIPTMDLYLGATGGWPAGKIIEFFGLPRTGKTTAALKATAEWQKRGGMVLWIDAEHAFEQNHAKASGIKVENLIVAQCDTIEEIFVLIDITLNRLQKQKWDKPVLVVVDSTTSVPTQADKDGDLEANERPGYEAKTIKRGLKKCNELISELNVTVIFINHSIAKFVSFGKKSDSGGGNGIKFYASARIEFANKGNLKRGEELYGQKVAIDIVKLKGAAVSFPKFDADLHFDKGFDSVGALFTAMVATNFASKPANAKSYTVLAGTAHETQIPTTGIHQWVNEHGGYDKIYMAWRRWAIQEGYLHPWGGKV
jgi:recombination protein RecA